MTGTLFFSPCLFFKRIIKKRNVPWFTVMIPKIICERSCQSQNIGEDNRRQMFLSHGIDYELERQKIPRCLLVAKPKQKCTVKNSSLKEPVCIILRVSNGHNPYLKNYINYITGQAFKIHFHSPVTEPKSSVSTISVRITTIRNLFPWVKESLVIFGICCIFFPLEVILKELASICDVWLSQLAGVPPSSLLQPQHVPATSI